MTLPRRWFLVSSLLCAALASLLFIPGLNGGFVLDDLSNIVNNQTIHLQTLDAGTLSHAAFSPQPAGASRLLPMLTFALDYWRAGGAEPTAFKATNIAIHALTTVVLVWFFRALLLAAALPARRVWLAAPVLALAWAIHPLQVSTVLYVVQRMQMLSTLFLLLALWAYLQARQAQIAGGPGRTGWMLTGLLWVLGIGCKEDAVLLPAYTLALELTVLRFAAAQPELAHKIRKAYLFVIVAGAVTYFALVLPHYWHWDAYPGRAFSSYERLLTQGRLLMMYMGQILIPLPHHMPFYYDWILPSRGLLQPWTTLPAILAPIALLIVAWRTRKHRPLFALGVFIFFAGHFITSNVPNLELAFEHRNHFPLIGAVLAVGDLLALVARRLRIPPASGIAICILLLTLLGSATTIRANTWSSRLSLARTSTVLAPHSARAWNSLCLTYDDLGGGRVPGNPNLDKAIEACSIGAMAAPYSLTGPTNLIVLKTRRGIATKTDWDRYLKYLQHAPMSPENRQAIWIIIDNVRTGVHLDEDNVLNGIDIFTNRTQLQSGEYTAIGYFILGHTHQQDRAYPYFAQAMRTAPPQDPLAAETIAEMKKQGRTEWAEKLGALMQNPGVGTAPHPAPKDHPR